jgi:Subunit ChlI of Mg-chelatase
MPLARTHSVALIGVSGQVVEIEADIANGLVGMILVGLPDTALREARDRIRAAIVNSGEEWPQRKITVGLSPASLPKRGSWFDLAARAGVFQKKHRGMGDGPSDDACSTQPRIRPRHPAVDRTAVTDLK